MALLNHLPQTGKGGSFASHLQGRSFLEGDTVAIDCDFGYERSATFMSSVIKTIVGELVWEPSTLNCNPKSCGEPPIPDHGYPSSQNYTFPNFFNYRCDDGFRFNQVLNSFYCGANGQWTPEPRNVRCDPVRCPEIQPPANGQLLEIRGNRYFESVATFRCDPTFTMIGDAERVCQADGQWGGEAVTCEMVPCPPMHASVRFLIQNDPIYIVECKNGKNVTIKCTAGRWSNPNPCNIMHSDEEESVEGTEEPVAEVPAEIPVVVPVVLPVVLPAEIPVEAPVVLPVVLPAEVPVAVPQSPHSARPTIQTFPKSTVQTLSRPIVQTFQSFSLLNLMVIGIFFALGLALFSWIFFN